MLIDDKKKKTTICKVYEQKRKQTKVTNTEKMKMASKWKIGNGTGNRNEKNVNYLHKKNHNNIEYTTHRLQEDIHCLQPNKIFCYFYFTFL